VSRQGMRNLANAERIEYAASLFAELKAIAVWNSSYRMRRHRKWWETIALLNRCRRRLEILSELVAIVAAMSFSCKPRTKSTIQSKRKQRRRSFLKRDSKT
jgi:hypothetical protein